MARLESIVLRRLECVSESTTPLGCKYSISAKSVGPLECQHKLNEAPFGCEHKLNERRGCSCSRFLLERTSNQSQRCPDGLILFTAAQVLKFPPTGGAAVDRQPDEEPQELLHMVPAALHCVGVADPLV